VWGGPPAFAVADAVACFNFLNALSPVANLLPRSGTNSIHPL
jgi:hypothetical protein